MNPRVAEKPSDFASHLLLAAMLVALLVSYLFLFAVFRAEPALGHAVAGQATDAGDE